MASNSSSLQFPEAAALTTPEQFYTLILRTILLSSDVYDSNVDPEYPADGSLPGGALSAIDHRIKYFRFFNDNWRRLFSALELLADPASKDLYTALILFRILGYKRIRIPLDHQRFFQLRSAVGSVVRTASQLPDALGHGVCHYEIPGQEQTIKFDCLDANVFFTAYLEQYYLRRESVVIQPQPSDHVVDAGGCFGDTAVAFSQSVHPEGHVYSFEIVASHLRLLRHNLAQNNVQNATVLPFGLSDCDREGANPEVAPSPGFQLTEAAPSRTLDSLVADGSVKRVDFLKMDIEGSEMAALRGAVGTLQQFRPKLAISIYHRPEDYFQIPEFIHGLGVGYQMYLENYTISDGETVLYAHVPV